MSNDETTSKESNSMSASLACLGTTTVCLHTSSNQKQEGLLAVFHDNDTLRLSLATNTDDKKNKSVSVYHGSIAMKDVKMKLEHPQKPDKQAKAFATHLLRTTSSTGNYGQSVTPFYSLSSDDDSDNIKLVIKYQHRVITQTKKKISHNKGSDDDDDDDDAMSEEEEVAMKKAWSGILSRDTSPTAPLEFYKTLGQSINRGQTTLTASQSQMEQLQRDRNSWKRTAQQLQGKWQHEKDQLLRNFCTLYNPTRQALATCQQENKQLQAQEQEQSTSNRKTKKKNKTAPQPDTEELQAPLPDVGDVYDDALAKAYATGKRVDIRNNNNNNQEIKMEPPFNNKTKKSSIDCSSSDSDDTVVDIPPVKTTTANKKVVRTKTNTTASNKQKKNAKHSAKRYDDSSDDDRKPKKTVKPKRKWDDSDSTSSDSTGNNKRKAKSNKKRKSPFSDDSDDST